MNNWKIINKIAFAFGIVFAVFTALAAVFNYEFSKVLYEPGAPASLFTYSYLIALLPFLAAAVLSFIVYAFSLHAAKSEAEQETETQEKETQPMETQPEPEDVFTEST